MFQAKTSLWNTPVRILQILQDLQAIISILVHRVLALPLQQVLLSRYHLDLA
jgi:hypothetical protein